MTGRAILDFRLRTEISDGLVKSQAPVIVRGWKFTNYLYFWAWHFKNTSKHRILVSTESRERTQ